jgi:hypothetical protein
MKRIHVLLVVIGLLLASCGGSTPESVVKDFYTAIQDKDFEKAELLSSKETKSMISLLKLGSDFNVSGNTTIEKVECVTEKEKAECDCWFADSEKTMAIVAIFEDGEWKVDAKATLGKIVGGAFSGLGDMGGILNGINELTKDGNLNKIVEGFSKKINEGSVDINEIVNSIDVDGLAKSISEMDTSLSKSLDLLKEKGIDIQKAVEELEKAKK